MANKSISTLLWRLCTLSILVAGTLVVSGGSSSYAVPQECSTCDTNYWNCTAHCPAAGTPGSKDCYTACRNELGSCSPGCTPTGMPYAPPCPGPSGCADYGNNCETNCTAERDVCVADCASGDTSCWNLCQNGLNICRAFCQSEYYDCLACSD
jgi:hypothetical protein